MASGSAYQPGNRGLPLNFRFSCFFCALTVCILQAVSRRASPSRTIVCIWQTTIRWLNYPHKFACFGCLTDQIQLILRFSTHHYQFNIFILQYFRKTGDHFHPRIPGFGQAIGNALKQLVVDIIKAAIRALVLKSIINVLVPGAGSAGGIGRGAGAIGQILGGGISSLAPGNGGGSGFAGGISVSVSGILTGRGTDLVAVVTGTNAMQGRSFAG